MNVRELHSWDVTPAEARRIQENLRSRVSLSAGPRPSDRPRFVAGIDVACPRTSPAAAIAGVVVMETPEMKVVERRCAVLPLTFPYIPGFLSFREGEAVTAALREVESDVDVFLFDGQGICHPRRFGIASHIGVLIDRPSIGCAKSHLVGTWSEPAEARGRRRRIREGKEVLGLVLRTRRGVKPLFVSVGHRVDLESAARIVLSCCRGYRLPEPTREAHRWVTELARTAVGERPC